ncbi:hypothetical protein CDAR_478671 [Caerostris darwini]|uniref:Uncharacterized protein n=1 Tax=Caerostris darwini TaxID=1538125 RepID=A0AAV4QM32_9ARAC|nr:hypothetical protein CDAR_478671 [Caerostris darwini]
MIRLHTIRHPTKEALYSSGSLSFHALDFGVLFKVRHKTELGYSEAMRGNEICECTRCHLAGLLNLMVASGTGIWECCGPSAPSPLFGRSINERYSPYLLRYFSQTELYIKLRVETVLCKIVWSLLGCYLD